jgi:iron(III) transport system substrate-binding protein
VLFYDFLISEAQPMLAGRQFVTVSRKIENPLRNASLRLIDPVRMLDQARRWQELFQKTVIDPSR